ncbi:MAG: hypothetical protein ACREJQ_08015 [bacterium]
MKRQIPLTILCFSVVTAHLAWVFVHPAQSLGNVKTLAPDAVKTMPADSQKIIGTLNTLAYSFQFFVYGEKRLPVNLEELVSSPYFPLPMTELTHPDDRKSAQFYSYLAMLPADATVGDFAIARDVFGNVHLQSVVRVETAADGNSRRRLLPHVAEVVFPPDAINYLAGSNDLTGEPAATVRNLSREDHQIYWSCALLNVASQDLALNGVAPWRAEPASVRSLAELQSYPWFANLRLINPYLRKRIAAVRADAPRPGDFTSYATSYKVAPPQAASGGSPAASPTEIRYPVFVCYGSNLKPVNPSALRALGEKPATIGVPTKLKDPALF